MKPALLLLAAGFVVITFGPKPFSGAEHTDLPVYASYAEMMLHGELPYRDFGIEYPPLAAPLLLLGGLAGTGPDEYKLAFALLTFVIACAVVWLIGAVAARTGGDRRSGADRGRVRPPAVRSSDPHPVRPRAHSAHTGRAGPPLQ